MLVFEAAPALDVEPAPFSHNGIMRKVRVFACQKLYDVHAELVGAVVQKGKAEIAIPVLVL